MKRIIQLVALGVICFSMATFAQSSSKWQNSPIIIDGDASDWETMPRFFNSDANVQYEIRNDARNLYVILKSTNKATQMQLLQAGFSVKFKLKNQSATKCDITFPAPKMGNFPAMERPNENKDRLMAKDARPERMMRDSATLDGFMYTNGIITEDNRDTEGICFAKSKGNRDQIVFEIQIPLREFFGNEFSLADITQTPLQLQVNINELSKGSMNGKGGNMSGGMHGGMGGGNMGGGHGGPGGGMGGGMPGGDMRGGNMEGGPDGEMGERPNMQGDMDGNDSSMSKKSFNIKFKLVAQR